MYIAIEEMNTVIEPYRMYGISDMDQSIIQSCINAAISRVSSYLGNTYDVKKIFSAVADDRDPDILEVTKRVALWFLVQRNNIDIIYDRVKEVFDSDIEYLKGLAEGLLHSSLPLKLTESGDVSTKIRAGSNKKFNHHFD